MAYSAKKTKGESFLTENNHDDIFEQIDIDEAEEDIAAVEGNQLGKKRTPAKASKRFWQLELWQPPSYTGYKVSAVLIAVLVWVFVIISQNPLDDRVFNIPLEVRNLNPELAMLETVDQIQVRVQGSNTLLNDISAADIVVYIDLSGVQAGRADIAVNVDLPDNIQLISLNPTSIPVELETVASEVFDLTVHNNASAAEKYRLLDPVASPSQITLFGAEKYLENVASVFVSAKAMDLQENYHQSLHISVVDFAGNDITKNFVISPSTVNVLIPVVTDVPAKSVAVNASLVGVPAEGYQISQIVIEPSTVTVLGDLQTLSSIYYLETEPLNINGLDQSYTQTLNIIHSNNVEISQNTVTVVVEIEPVSTKTFDVGILYPQNLPTYLACSLPDIPIQLELSGPKTNIAALTANDIVPYVDFTGILEPGVYDLPLGATLPANISLVSISPQRTTVTVTPAGE